MTALADLQRLAIAFLKTRPAPPPTTPVREVACLPYEDVRDQLARNPMVVAMRVDVRRVYTCLVELLAMREGKQAHTPPPRTAPPVADGGRRSVCCATAVETFDAREWVCTSCGAVQGVCVRHEDHVRYFAEDRYDGRRDPSQWSRVDDIEDAWDEASDLMPLAFGGRASPHHREQVVALLRMYKTAFGNVHGRVVAATAAWILVESPDVRREGRMRDAFTAPPAPFACPRGCGLRFDRRVDARVHRCATAVTRVEGGGAATPVARSAKRMRATA